MKNLSVPGSVLSLSLMALLAACERPHAPPPPKATASPAAPSTVSLSGTILDPQPNPVTRPPVAPGATPSAATGASSASTVAGSAGDEYWGDSAPRADGAVVDNEALREFQAQQEQRDRELLERDTVEAQALARDGRQPYDLPPEDGDWTAADDDIPPDDGPIDEPPMDEEPPIDDRYDDPPDSGYRP